MASTCDDVVSRSGMVKIKVTQYSEQYLFGRAGCNAQISIEYWDELSVMGLFINYDGHSLVVGAFTRFWRSPFYLRLPSSQLPSSQFEDTLNYAPPAGMEWNNISVILGTLFVSRQTDVRNWDSHRRYVTSWFHECYPISPHEELRSWENANHTHSIITPYRHPISPTRCMSKSDTYKVVPGVGYLHLLFYYSFLDSKKKSRTSLFCPI